MFCDTINTAIFNLYTRSNYETYTCSSIKTYVLDMFTQMFFVAACGDANNRDKYGDLNIAEPMLVHQSRMNAQKEYDVNAKSVNGGKKRWLDLPLAIKEVVQDICDSPYEATCDIYLRAEVVKMLTLCMWVATLCRADRDGLTDIAEDAKYFNDCWEVAEDMYEDCLTCSCEECTSEESEDEEDSECGSEEECDSKCDSECGTECDSAESEEEEGEIKEECDKKRKLVFLSAPNPTCKRFKNCADFFSSSN